MIKTNVKHKSIQLHRLNFKMYEYKTRLLAGAAVVLQALLLLMPVSAFATAGDVQEIGVPQAMEVPVKGCAAAVLLPDEGRIYSVYEGVLTQYAISPFKKIGSIAIDWGKRKDKLDEKECRVGITNDKSKFILLLGRTKALLLDASTGQILNTVERKNDRPGSALLNDNELVTLDVARESAGEGITPFFNLTIWDANTLKFKREIRDMGNSFGFFWDQHSGPLMSKSANRIYLATDQSLVVLNSKTYAPELSLFRPGIFEAADIPKISKNFQKLALRGVSKVTDHLTGKTTSYDDVKTPIYDDVSRDRERNRVLIFDQETREFHRETKEFKRESMEHISGEEYVSFRGRNLHISRSKEYLVSMAIPSIGALLSNLSTGMWVIFKQYESGEAILMEYSFSGGPRYFQLTPGARKYLMMKNSAGKIVPINDVTFAKYHRTQSSH